MTTQTKSKKSEKPKSPENKFKVIPNLSLKGNDILTRLKNGSLKLGSNAYNSSPQIEATRRMSKIDIARKMVENQQTIQSIKSNLSTLKKS